MIISRDATVVFSNRVAPGAGSNQMRADDPDAEQAAGAGAQPRESKAGGSDGGVSGATPTVNLVALPVQNVTRANVTGYAAYTEPVTYYEYLHPTG